MVSFTVALLMMMAERFNKLCLLGVTCIVVSWVSLQAQSQGGVIRGVVRDKAGLTLPGAKIMIVDAAGSTVRSATAAPDGTYRVTSIPAGSFSMRVDYHGYLGMVRYDVVVRNAEEQAVNFNLTAATKADRGLNPLGPAHFYEDSEFIAGQVRDPTAGGGYSDSASAQSNEMVEQYLAASASLGSEGGHDQDKQMSPLGKHAEADFETSGAALLARHDYGIAVRLFLQGVQHYPGSSPLQMGLGISLYGQGHYDDAVHALCDAAKLDPDNPRPYALLTEADQFSSRLQPEVTSMLERYVDAHPQSSDSHYDYGMALLKQFRTEGKRGSLVRAQSEMQEAVAIDPEFADAHRLLGVIEDQEGQPESAAKEYRKAIRLNPNDAQAIYRLAEDYRRLGMKAQAASTLQAYAKLRSKQPQPPRQ
jgi:Flp pilus assembly protein TadD